MSNQDFKGCPQCGARGTALGAIVAKETSNGEFTGSASGIGVGTGGVGVGVGSVSGTSTNTSHRAAQFSAPGPRAKDPASGALLVGMWMLPGAAVIYRVIPTMLTMFGEDTNGSILIPQFYADAAGIGLALAVVVMGLSMMYRAMTMSDDSPQMQAYNRDKALDQARLGIHQRLRYCDSDHQVFDPVSGQGCVAEEHYIHNMVYSIANAEMSSPSA